MRLLGADLDKIVFEGLPGPRRKPYNQKNALGQWVRKIDWPAVAKEIERKKNLTPIEQLDEPLDFSKLSAPLCVRLPKAQRKKRPRKVWDAKLREWVWPMPPTDL
jgi:hypothetical protein